MRSSVSNMAKVSRTEFKKQLAQFAAEQRRIIESEVAGFSRSSADQKQRINRVKTDFEFFCRTYFPHFIKGQSASVFHRFVYDEIPKILDVKQGVKKAIAAPRGEAKSTLLTQLFSTVKLRGNSDREGGDI